jgi:predicted CXXCH cytochrome family protein
LLEVSTVRSPIIKERVVYCVVAFVLALPCTAEADGVSIVHPPDLASPAARDLLVVGAVEGSDVSTVTVEITGGSLKERSSSVPVVFGGFSFKVSLAAGANVITVRAGSAGSASTRLFKRGSEDERPPAGYRPFTLHSKELELAENCTSCHEVSEKKTNYRRMTVGRGTCATSSCHDDMGAEEYVHGPAAGGVCISCHNPHGSVNQFYVSRSGADLCYACHEDKAAQMSHEFQHTPVARGDCSACHDPHGAANKYQLRGTASELCFQCHEDNMTDQNFVHGPVAGGECSVCHNPHSSPFPNMLAAEGSELCFLCHEDRKPQFSKAHKHEPVEQDCSLCHSPHGAVSRFQLKSAIPDLCEGCHQEVVKLSKESTFKHDPAARGDCTSCHDPHTADAARLLKRPGSDLCFTCHEEMGENIMASEFKHGPVRQGDCAACHSVHGAENPSILKRYFPEEFYSPYSTDKYALCFDCHNEDIALDEETKTLTGFRSDEKNLHYLHVNKPDHGRSCKACHEVHASNQSKHIRTEVPYGKMWSYPIDFTASDTGGDCNVGCHKPLEYSREN